MEWLLITVALLIGAQVILDWLIVRAIGQQAREAEIERGLRETVKEMVEDGTEDDLPLDD